MIGIGIGLNKKRRVVSNNSFSPTDISSLIHWWDADTLSGSTVTSWADKVGGIEATVPGGGTAPSLVANWNASGRNTVRSDTPTKRLAMSFSAISPPFTWFLSGSIDDNASYALGILVAYGSTYFRKNGFGNVTNTRMSTVNRSGDENYNVPGNDNSQPSIFGSTWDTSGPQRQVFYQNIRSERNQSVFASSTYSMTGFHFFNQGGGGSQSNGNITDLLVFNKKLTDEQMTQVAEFLADSLNI